MPTLHMTVVLCVSRPTDVLQQHTMEVIVSWFTITTEPVMHKAQIHWDMSTRTMKDLDSSCRMDLVDTYGMLVQILTSRRRVLYIS